LAFTVEWVTAQVERTSSSCSAATTAFFVQYVATRMVSMQQQQHEEEEGALSFSPRMAFVWRMLIRICGSYDSTSRLVLSSVHSGLAQWLRTENVVDVVSQPLFLEWFLGAEDALQRGISNQNEGKHGGEASWSVTVAQVAQRMKAIIGHAMRVVNARPVGSAVASISQEQLADAAQQKRVWLRRIPLLIKVQKHTRATAQLALIHQQQQQAPESIVPVEQNKAS
jgi:hypothetical protein